MRLRTLKKQKIRFHSYFSFLWYLWKAKIRFHSYFISTQLRWICINWMQPNENVRLRPLTRKLSESILFVMIHCQGETQWICELKPFVLYTFNFLRKFWTSWMQLKSAHATQPGRWHATIIIQQSAPPKYPDDLDGSLHHLSPIHDSRCWFFNAVWVHVYSGELVHCYILHWSYVFILTTLSESSVDKM